MSWTLYHIWLEATAKTIDKSITLTTKDHWFWKILGSILAFFRLMTKKQFLESYATTLGPIQAYPSSWTFQDVEQVSIHESEHTKQCRACSLGLSPWLGLPILGILYGCFPLPIGFAWARYRFELNAARSEWKWMLRHGIREELVKERALSFAKTISSSAYGWSMPQKWALWGFERIVEKEIRIFKQWSAQLTST